VNLQKRLLSPVLVALIGASLLISCSNQQKKTEAKTDSVVVEKTPPPEIPVYKDSALDFKARFIAGMLQEDSNSFYNSERDPFWLKYKVSVDTNWNKMYRTRLSKIKAWEDSTLSKTRTDTLPLFYPFSGPDFLHAFYLYPNTTEFILGALEPIVNIPALDSIKPKERDRFLDSLNHSLRDVFYKSYFITTHMQKDMKQIRGVLPPLYFFIERSGHELLEQKFITLDSTGTEREVKHTRLHWQKVPGVKLTFRNRETRQIKTLYYFNLDISNPGLKKKPEFVKFVMKRKPFNTFVKSASYLMHNPIFSQLKNMILDESQSLFQDDTGIAYKDIKRRLDVNVQLYGDYIKPVKDFGSYTFQADLDSAYKNSPNKQKLPFSLGYHWETKIQNYMMISKGKKISVQR
jgi:hypothetical protein